MSVARSRQAFTRSLLPVVIAAVCSGVIAAPAVAETQRAVAGAVVADLRFERPADTVAEGLTLTITRAGHPAFDAPLTDRGCPGDRMLNHTRERRRGARPGRSTDS